MKSLLQLTQILVFLLTSSSSFAHGDFVHGDEVDSSIKAFHSAFHINTESYLICIYNVYKQSTRTGYPDQINVKATVIEAIQGNKKVGEKFSFERILDGQYGDVSGMVGGLFYVFLYTDESGNVLVSSQDPQALWEYSHSRYDVCRLLGA